MEQSKSKPMTTSVPSIRFNANAEELEELHGNISDEDNASISISHERASFSGSSQATFSIGEPDSSPLKYLPKLVKRSTSTDVSQASLDSSPPSDPWRFFSDIKGKITKSVEEKITEIKARNQEESSPCKSKLIKDSKENSSISDSEDLSESSISRTCGIVSTTEGVEMSSDDDTPSLERDKKEDTKKLLPASTATSGLRQRFRLLRNKSTSKDGTISINNLSKLYNINTEKVEQALPEDCDDVESAVDALVDSNFETDIQKKNFDTENVLKSVSQKIDNIEVDTDNVINIRDITGNDIRSSFFNRSEGGRVTTIFAPTGFVDLRYKPNMEPNKYAPWILLFIIIFFYFVLQNYSPYFAGIIVGMFLTSIANKIYSKVFSSGTANNTLITNTTTNNQFMEIPAVKEYQPIAKYEGWVNEYPETYNPHTYHISQTQSVFLRLQGNLLRISHTRSKIPKRAMWNECKHKSNFTHHRIYNLLGAKIVLLPDGLAKIRHWSKKYPICIILNKDQINLDPEIMSKIDFDDNGKEENKNESDKSDSSQREPKHKQSKQKKGVKFKKEVPVLRFSKLTEEEEDVDLESDSRASTPSPDISDGPVEDSTNQPVDEENMEDTNEDDLCSLDEWSTLQDDSPTDMKIFIFGRTDREKEDWFRRLTCATHGGANIPFSDVNDSEVKEAVSDTLLDLATTEADYMKYMSIFTKPTKKPSKKLCFKKDKEKSEAESSEEATDGPKQSVQVLWLNALIGRILFDCMRDPTFTVRVRERIQRKLGAIKLPYFIEELLITELSLGKTPPLVKKTAIPILDERGLWVDLDLTYEGLVVLTLQTKLNLMKLKDPKAHEKSTSEVRSAMFHSDVDDSAESSSDDETQELQNPSPLDSSTYPLMGLGSSSGSSNSSKKFIKMVDRIAESKFFQAATENKYIKKAMEGVSNTDLRLTVEVRSLVGTLVLNIPPPPSDRIWVGFRPTPKLLISAHPIVGERNITFLYVTSWIERKLAQEFQKIMVIPNMEDFVIPVMNPKLPE